MNQKRELEKLYKRFLLDLNKNLVSNKEKIIENLNLIEDLLIEMVK
jgi:uncharacterized protein YaaW (UPF0174 family)